MKIAYLCLDPGVPVFGRKGSSIHCQEVIRQLTRMGHQVTVFAFRTGSDRPADLSDIKTFCVGQHLPGDMIERERKLILSNRQLADHLEAVGPFDLIYERYSLWSDSAQVYAHRSGIPSILEVNSPLIDEQKRFRDLYHESTAREISDRCLANAASIIAVSEQVKQQVATPETISKICVVPNGVNCDSFSSTTMASSRPASIGFVGTLKPWHGVEQLIDAFGMVAAHCPGTALKIIGSGPQEHALRQRASRLPPEVRHSIQWWGARQHAEIPHLLQETRIAVAPYPKLNNFYFSPLKILEYMAAGNVVVASRLGQIPDLLPSGTGVLVQPGSVTELATTIRHLLRHPDLCDRLAANAKQHVSSNYTWRRCVSKILQSVSSRPLAKVTA